MEFIIAKIYELLIKRELKKIDINKITFEYSILIERGFTEKFITPNPRNRVTVYFYRHYWSEKESHYTFRNIRQAYEYFRRR